MKQFPVWLAIVIILGIILLIMEGLGMKIKTNKKLSLPQLIEWGFGNDMRNKNFESEGGAMVYFDYDGNLTCAREFSSQDFFTVEVEEEIDEFSDIKRLAHYTIHGFTSTNFSKSIGELRKSDSLAFYIMNDDRTLTLIWTKEKGMLK